MKWKKYTIYTTTQAEDLVSLMLNENGVEGVQIENYVPLSEADTRGMFIDILPEMQADDGSSRVSFFLRLEEELSANAQDPGKGAVTGKPSGRPQPAKSEDRSYTIEDRIWTQAEIAELLDTVRRELSDMAAYTDIGEGRIEEGSTEDTDWRDNWKQFFKPIEVGHFLIKPSWESLPEEEGKHPDEERTSEGCGGRRDGAPSERIVLEIDPGTAFGTGSHETTRLCLEAVEKHLTPGDRVLDIGTGSGILGIAALKSGAACCAATELDEMCAPSIRENLLGNGISEEDFHLILGNILDDSGVQEAVHAISPGGYDIVLANILAPVIALLAAPGAADRFCREGGLMICSGIIDTRLEEVLAAFRANPSWEMREVREMGEWRSVIAARRPGQMG